MPRLKDLIARHGVRPPGYVRDLPAWRREMAALLLFLQESPSFLVDEQAEYVYAGTGKEEFDWIEDFPNIAPPYKNFWMEYRRPSRLHSDVHGDRPSDIFPRYCGFLFHSVVDPSPAGTSDQTRRRSAARSIIRTLDTQSFRERADAALRKVQANEELNRTDRFMIELASLESPLRAESIPESLQAVAERVSNSAPHWLYEIRCFITAPDDDTNIIGPMGIWLMAVDALGHNIMTPLYTVPHLSPDQAESSGVLDSSGAEVWPCLHALSLLHCKNVSVEEQAPEPKLSHAFQRRTGKPLSTFKTLKIRSMQRRSTNGANGASGVQMPLHMRRGNFKHYGPAYGTGKLFGRIEGVFWWDAIAIGKPEHGKVTKQYEVEEPEHAKA